MARFTYYVDPDGTQNIEFDPARNLFPDFNPRDMKFPKAPWHAGAVGRGWSS